MSERIREKKGINLSLCQVSLFHATSRHIFSESQAKRALDLLVPTTMAERGKEALRDSKQKKKEKSRKEKKEKKRRKKKRQDKNRQDKARQEKEKENEKKSRGIKKRRLPGLYQLFLYIEGGE